MIIFKMGTQGSISRVEILSLAFRLTVVTAASYFMVKWMVKQLDPTNNQKKAAKKKALEQLNRVGIANIKELSDYEMMIASHLVDPNEIDVSWENIAGLEDIIQELKETVILPIKRKDLFGTSKLAQAPKGVLLHGPPGCGKTLIAKATAREAGTHFINLDVSILVDKWYGESQKLATAVFTLALKIQPCIIFIDEIDSFLRNRNTQDHEATAMMKAQFMALWDGLTTDPACTVIIMGATNRPHDLDRAILRRMPSTFHIKMPNASQRHQILHLILQDESIDVNVDLDTLAHMAEGFSGSDLQEMCRNASLYRVRDYMRTSTNTVKAQGGNSSSSVDVSVDDFRETLRPITMDDLMTTHRKMKDSKTHCELNHL